MVPTLLYMVATRSRRLVSGAETYMYSCLVMTERLQAGNDPSSKSAADATIILRKRRRDEFTDTTFHYNAGCAAQSEM